MKQPLNFETLKQLPNIEGCGSDYDNDPYNDPSLTLFLNNGYRLVSEKTLYGQGLTLTPFKAPTSQEDAGYESLVKHALPNPVITINTTPAFYRFRNQAKEPITREEFGQAVKGIVGEEVLDFLTDRHGFLAYRRT